MPETKPISVLVVEDEPQIAASIKSTLSNAGFDCHLALSAANFLQQLASVMPDLCVIDLGLPDLDGMDLINEVKARTRASVLILTGRGSIKDKVSGLETGADDYMVKPFDHDELVARIKSIVRRKPAGKTVPQAKEVACFEHWQFNLSSNKLLSKSGDMMLLTVAEAELLRTLVKNPRRILSRERLLCQRNFSPTDRSVDIRISRLRKKLEQGCTQMELIKTVYGAGYVFLADVVWTTEPNE